MGLAEVRGGGLVARLEPGRLALRIEGGPPLLEGLTARVGLEDGTTWPLPPGPWQALGGGARCEGVIPDSIRRRGGTLALAWEVVPHGEGLVLSLVLENRGSEPVCVAWLAVLEASWPASWTPGALRVSQTGWQSWSPATPPIPLADQRPLPEPPLAGPGEVPPDGFSSPWMCELAPTGLPGLLAGFLSAARWTGYIRLSPGWSGGRLAAVCSTEGLPLRPGERMRSEPLLLQRGGPEAAARYAAAVAEALGVFVPARKSPRGWCSWYTRFGAVTEADVLRNVEHLARRRPGLPVEVVQLDDGWQREPGDWLEARPTFPQGLAQLATAIRTHGFTPGIWLAPFLVGARSQVCRDHPEWLLRAPDGSPLLALHHWGQPCHGLDLAHPGARTHLAHVVRTLVETWGFRFLKLDFLYAGALQAPRTGGLTALEAYALGLRTLREAAGEAFLLGCGAPLLPSVGAVDAMRIGPDVADGWSPEDGDPSSPALANALRSTLARGWMHGRWWLNDPDCLLLGPEHRHLTAAERFTWATVVQASGGAVFLSDEVSTLPPEAQALAERLMAGEGTAATLLEADHHGDPTRAWLPVPAWGQGAGVAIVFNPDDRPVTVMCSPRTWPAPPTPWVLDPTDEGAGWQAWSPARALQVAPHGVRTLFVAPAPVPAERLAPFAAAPPWRDSGRNQGRTGPARD